MPYNPDLEDTIVSSLEDAEMEPLEASTDDSTESDTPDTVEAVEAVPEAGEAASTTPVEEGKDWDGRSSNLEVGSPASKSAPAEKDDFEKKFGIPANSSSGRENRIPYSRVKKITEKAVADKQKELETSYTPRITEFETKIKDYEERLGNVATFEQVLVKPDQFLPMLAQMPEYKPFFDAINAAFEAAQKVAPTAGATVPAPVDDMPQPDQKLSDGSMVYSMDGLKALNEWNRTQARKEVMSEVEKRYAPIEQEWQAHQRVQAVIPKVQAQINEARTWPQFNENEADIVKALQANGTLSLERAYQQVVYPKLIADRNKMREDILNEVKAAPRATSAPSSARAAAPKTSNEPRSIEDVIREATKTLK